MTMTKIQKKMKIKVKREEKEDIQIWIEEIHREIFLNNIGHGHSHGAGGGRHHQGGKHGGPTVSFGFNRIKEKKRKVFRLFFQKPRGGKHGAGGAAAAGQTECKQQWDHHRMKDNNYEQKTMNLSMLLRFIFSQIFR